MEVLIPDLSLAVKPVLLRIGMLLYRWGTIRHQRQLHGVYRLATAILTIFALDSIQQIRLQISVLTALLSRRSLKSRP
jgi:hypothetical protein